MGTCMPLSRSGPRKGLFWNSLTLAVRRTLGAGPKSSPLPGGPKVKGVADIEMGRKQNFLRKRREMSIFYFLQDTYCCVSGLPLSPFSVELFR